MFRPVLQGRGGASAGSAWSDRLSEWDIAPRPNYPFEFVLGDATQADLSGYDLCGKPSVPRYSRCKALAQVRNGGQYGEHPKLIETMRDNHGMGRICRKIENGRCPGRATISVVRVTVWPVYAP